MDWMHLKSGTDIRGVAMDGAPSPKNLTEEVAAAAARAFAARLREQQPDAVLTVAVGRDSRLSGPALAAAVIDALAASGCNVIDCGLASTPAMFMTTVDLSCDGAVQITASHHPYYRNGLKFFLPTGGLEGAQITEILNLAAAGKRLPMAEGKVKTEKYMNTYAARLRKMICQEVNAADYEYPLAGTHIVVDAGNGVGGFYATKVLEPLGADITGSQFLDPDGSFPNHIPNPENKEAMASACAATLRAAADLGVIFDTDVDRAGAVLSDGSELNRNRIIAMLATILLREHPGTTIVTDSITSTGLAKFIEEKGGVHHRFKRGYRNVINESIRLNGLGQDSQLAIETSGHGAFKENYFLDDGAYIVTKLLIELARGKKEGYTLESLIASLEEPAESKEFRMNILVDDFKAYGQQVIDELTAYVANQPGWSLAPNNFEGVRVNLDADHGEGWFLLRLSLHDPLLPLNIESNIPGGALIIARELAKFLAGYDKLEAAKLMAFVQ